MSKKRVARTRRTGFMALLLVGLLALTGCVDVTERADVNPDGSGSVSFVMRMDKKALASLSEGGTGGEKTDTSAFSGKGIKKSIKDPDIKVEAIDDASSVGYTLSTEFKKPEELDAAMTKLLKSIPSESTGGGSSPAAGEQPKWSLEKSGGLTGSKYRVEIAIPKSKESTASPEGKQAAQMMSSVVKAHFVVALPGKMGETNGTVAGDGKSVEFTPDLTGAKAQSFYAESSTSSFIIPLVGGLLLLLLLAGGGMAAFVLIKRKKGTAVPATTMPNMTVPMSAAVGGVMTTPASGLEAFGITPSGPAARRRLATVTGTGSPLDGVEVLTDGEDFFLGDGREITKEQLAEFYQRGFLKQ